MPFASPHMSGAEIRGDMRGSDVQASNPSKNWGELALSVARVKEVQYEELKCSIVVLTGESDIYEYSGIDITLPGGGRRHFLGALPERGDLCVVGWAVRESSGTASSRVPVILGWVPPAPWMGHEWTPFARYAPGEGLDTPRERAVATGLAERVRFKLRHIGPGDVLASSAEGSDLVLDDSVLLSNRRGVEVVLRDSDSSFIARSVASYSVTSGTRVYSGPVAREARLLQPTLFTDLLWWDAPIEQSRADGTPVSPSGFILSPEGEGFLKPGLIFQRDVGESEARFVSEGGGDIPDGLDPFSFLSWGGFVLRNGQRGDAFDPSNNVIYAGKPLYRVGVSGSFGSPVEGVVNASSPSDGLGGTESSLTEYRIEVSHTSDGLLPVTEQTDGFDADRLPLGDPASVGALSPRRAFIEWVIGSVVGNDAFSPVGRPLYGIPLAPRIRGNAPGLISGIGLPLSEHAASLFRLSPPGGRTSGGDSWVSWTKAGALRVRISEARSSFEGSLVGPMSLDTGGVFVSSTSGMLFTSTSGMALRSTSGPVLISGAGSTRTNESSTDPDSSVEIRGESGVGISSPQGIRLAASSISLGNATRIDLRAQNSVHVMSGQRLSLSAQQLGISATGGMETVISGPRDGDSSSGPSHRFQINATPLTGSMGGETDKYTMTYGDRVEEFTMQGSHSTKLTLGDFTFETLVGKHTIKAMVNEQVISDDEGYELNVNIGDIDMFSMGSMTLSSVDDATFRSNMGSVNVRGLTGITLASPGPASGGILCGSDRDPLTGLTYEALGLPSRNQKLSA